ncbi:RNA polymerase ADP-ribosylase [Proteus phage vB_PmiM_Pm5461]|uniref:NAD(+)--arginine ADP-ribosyltransferase n=1 Tax=Proteus phage vB_PmiM_Pm5461 TaxID=1636250 RepID=A0A0G2SSA5_9CAUD|nr:Alt-like RNA polymerase ADP-ribosyltransferase [Proteus phage vB_PmiM_Pm5461]AKA62054.1 RNA polymerase ADP-ribosylase [Proteus phage vB_PmiM_Pm5461]
MELSEINLNEVFDSEIAQYQAINVNQKAKVPQLWNIKVPGNDNLLVRMVSYLSKGDAVKQVKMGDKFVQVFLMSLSKNGNAAELRDGLGADPIGALNTIFDTVYEQVKKLKIDAVLFRFPAKKMKGQEKSLQRIIKRLAMQRTGGKFVVLEDLYQFTGKHAYVLIYRKNKPLEDISGIPDIDSSLYTKVESKVGDVYINYKTGKQVSKMEAIAGSIAAQENERNERSLISKTKVSRRELMTALYSISKPDDLDGYSKEAKEAFVKFQGNPPIYSSVDAPFSRIQTRVNEKTKETFSNIADMLPMSDDEQVESKYHTELDNIRTAVVLAIHNEDKYLSPSELDLKIKPYMLKLSEILKSDKEIIFKFKDITEYTLKYLPSDIEYSEKLSSISKIIQAISSSYTDVVGSSYRNLEESIDYTAEEKDAITNYTSQNYEDINSFLLGNDEATKKTINTYIPNLDKAFSKGVKLDRSTILYRAQRHEYKDLDKSVKNKILYFPNFVSTSLAPIFFNKGFSNSASSYIGQPQDWETEARETLGDKVVDSNAERSSDYIARLGIMISGVHKVKVIVPGDLSRFSHESEVILPRGSALKIRSIHGSGELSKSFLIDTVYMPAEDLVECTEVFDGDKFLNEGVLEKINFRNFVKEQEIIKENQTLESSEAMSILADIMDFDQIPEKFIN